MPVILDRLPLPNITWYTGISVLCLLCSVYYAGVQVKIHPDWKEQLLQRNAMASAGGRGTDDKFRYRGGDTGDPPPLHWGVFNSNDQDEEGYCSLDDQENDDLSSLDTLSDLIQERNHVCVGEDFEDVLRAAFYDEMCYIRYGSFDVAFSNYMNHNAARRAQGKSPYLPGEYTRRCQQAARKLAQKYNTSNAVANAINLNLKNMQDWTSAENQADSHGDVPSEFLGMNPGKSERVKGSRRQHHEQPPAKAPVNQCTTDTFYDSYERAVDGEVSLYHIPLYDSGCDDMERELSPYLIPEIISFMFHEPLCIWTLINMAYCILILLGTTIQHMVFGELRVSEQQHIKDKFWNFVFYKFIFVFGVMNVKHMDEAVLWCSWFSVLGFLHLLAQLCKDRFEYLSFSGHTGRRTHIRLLCLLGIILLVATACLVISVLVGCHAGINTFAFMAAECVLLIVRTLYVITRYSIYLWDITHQGLWEKRGGYVYATELVFELSELTIDMVHHIHMLVWGNIMLTMASLVICMQLRLLFYQLQHKVKTHRNYLRVRKLLARYPEVQHPLSLEQEGITCAICWEAVAKGRRLPCTHVFHTDCLLAWLPQHLSCPTCRHRLRPAAASSPAIESGGLTFLSRLFSRRSSDPLDANNSDASGNNSGASNTSSRNNSRNTSENNSPLHSSVETSSTLAGLSSASVFKDHERVLAASSASAKPLEERLVIVSSSSSAGHATEAAVSHDGVTASFVYHNIDDDIMEEVADEKPPKAGDNDDDDELQHSSHGENANGFGGGSDSLLLDHDSVFWGVGGADHRRRRHHHHGGAGAGGEGGRYVSWLSSFSVEQRHTQLRPQLNVTPSAESSLHSMALQVQQMFPHMDYSDIISDLRRTRSIMSTVDNILEDNLSTSPPRSSPYTTSSSGSPSASGAGSWSPSVSSFSPNIPKRVSSTPNNHPVKPTTESEPVQQTKSAEDDSSCERASTIASTRFSDPKTAPKSVLKKVSLPEVEQSYIAKKIDSKTMQEGISLVPYSVSSSSDTDASNNIESQRVNLASTSISSCCHGASESVSPSAHSSDEQHQHKPMLDSTSDLELDSTHTIDLEEARSESSASMTHQVNQDKVAVEDPVPGVSPRSASLAFDSAVPNSFVRPPSVCYNNGPAVNNSDIEMPTLSSAATTHITLQKDSIESFKDARNIKQYDVNEPNNLSSICDSGEEDDYYTQILRDAYDESVPTFENISNAGAASLVGRYKEEDSSLRRRVEKEKVVELPAFSEINYHEVTHKHWGQLSSGRDGCSEVTPEHWSQLSSGRDGCSEVTHKHWSQLSSGRDWCSIDEDTNRKPSSSTKRRRQQLSKSSSLSPTSLELHEATLQRTTAGVQDSAGREGAGVTAQLQQVKAGDVEVESARGASLQAVGSFGGRFSKSPSERESLLLGRQQLLYSTARDRLLKGGSSGGVDLNASTLDSISVPVDGAASSPPVDSDDSITDGIDTGKR